MLTPKNFNRLSGGRVHENSPRIRALISALDGIGPSSAEDALKVKNLEDFKVAWPWYVVKKTLSSDPLWIEVVACCIVVLSLEQHRHYDWRYYEGGRDPHWVFVERFDEDVLVYCKVDGDGVFPTPQEWEAALEAHSLAS